MARIFRILFCSVLLLVCAGMQAAKPGTFTAGEGTFLLNGKPFIVKAAEVHYPRIPRPYWDHRIKMCKALGILCLCRVGDGRSALVAAQEEGHQAA